MPCAREIIAVSGCSLPTNSWNSYLTLARDSLAEPALLLMALP